MLMRAVNIVVALSLPATVGLMALAEPIIRLLYRRGSFDDTSASATALALTCFAVGLVGHSVFEVVVRGFYALRDTMRPVIITVVGVAFNIALSLIFTMLFLQNGWRAFGGIALANSIATLLEAAALLLWLHLRTGLIRPHVAALWQAFGKASVASALMLAVLLGLVRVGLLSNNDSAIAHLVGLGVMISLGGGVYVLAAYLLRSDELLFFVDMLSRRFHRSANTQTKQR
jgi:putative peptidoglycan lipid II flippase